MSNPYLERGHSLKTKRTGRINAGLFTPEREAALEWIGWFCDNDIPRSMQNEIAEAFPCMIERMEYIETLCDSCWAEMPGCECEVHFREYRKK